jgi:lysozyme
MFYISDKGINIIKEHTFIRTKPFLDRNNIPTIGLMTTYYPDGSAVSLDDPQLSLQEALDIVKEIIDKEYAPKLYIFIKQDLNQDQIDALLSLMYDIGPVMLQKSKLLRIINKDPNNKAIIYPEWLRYDRKDGRPSNPAMLRRTREAALYFSHTSTLNR